MTALLDTHVLIWWLEDSGRLSEAQQQIIETASPGAPLVVSEMSILEIATLYRLRRIELAIPLRDWLEKAVAPPLVRRQGISPAIAAEVAALPDWFHRDPADRVMVATVRTLGATLLTQDRRIIESGLVATVG
ncbi:MAG: type II toxin-antitoxin system VapC family toxin [Acidobacteria bacterium]|nr:type II toxin-antitoxin system VapC family toxin [Acidobacteriota bacterium]